MVAGQAGTEMTQLNIESLWSGGPFQNSVRDRASLSLGPRLTLRAHVADGCCMQSYNGGNKQPDEAAAMAADLKTIRQAIFESPNGTIQSEWPPLLW